MLEMAHYVSDDVILERLLPYMFHLVTDDVPRVRAHTISTITNCLRLVKNVPRNEGNIFPEYILPNLVSFCINDNNNDNDDSANFRMLPGAKTLKC